MSIATCGAVIFDEQGRILLVEHRESAGHKTGVFGLPAGRIEVGEDALTTAVREVEEETGLCIDPKDFQKLSQVYKATIGRKDGPQTFTFEVFTTQIRDGQLKEGPETKPQWVSWEQMSSLDLLPNVFEAVEEAQDMVKLWS